MTKGRSTTTSTEYEYLIKVKIISGFYQNLSDACNIIFVSHIDIRIFILNVDQNSYKIVVIYQ